VRALAMMGRLALTIPALGIALALGVIAGTIIACIERGGF
jgi:hypothetical protein